MKMTLQSVIELLHPSLKTKKSKSILKFRRSIMTTLSEIKIENLKSFENNHFIFSAKACRRLGIETRIDLTSTQPVTKFRTDEIIGKENNESREMRGEVNA